MGTRGSWALRTQGPYTHTHPTRSDCVASYYVREFYCVVVNCQGGCLDGGQDGVRGGGGGGLGFRLGLGLGL